MDATLDRLVQLYRFPSGRRLYALLETEQLAKQNGFTELTMLLTAAITHEREAYRLTAEWRQARIDRTPRFGGEAVELDREIDGVLSAVDRVLDGHQAAARGDAAQSIRQLREALFPGGVFESISLPFVEELAELERILELADGDYKSQLDDLALSGSSAELARLSQRFRALVSERQEGLDYGEVRDAQDKGQEFLLRVVAMIVGHYAGLDGAAADGARGLLSPILTQNDEIGAHRRGRRAVPDVDPDTGQELPPEPGIESQ